jgi:ribosomal protein S12 methylthiotransferase accessory factor
MNPTTLPQIKPQYRVEIIEPKQVYLLSEHSSHALTGQLYCQIVPLLNGQNTLADITQTLDGQVPPGYIDYVLNRLTEKGFLTEAAPDLSPEAAAFWSELGIAPTLAAQALQQQEVTLTVVGNISDSTAAVLTQALRSTGVTVQAPQSNGQAPASPALQVVLTDDYLQPQLTEINQQAQATGQPWLLLKPLGSILWLGPIFVPGNTGCWHCLVHRLRGNREVETSVLRQKQKQANGANNGKANDRLDVIGCLPTARATLPSTLNMGLQLAATEITKWLVQRHSTLLSAPLASPAAGQTQGQPPQPPVAASAASAPFPILEAKLITFNQTTLDLKTHALPHRPQCPCCGDTQLLRDRGFQPLQLTSRKKTLHP